MQLESSNGKQTNHKTVGHGLLAGETAIGRWGLMPSTIKEMYNRKKGKLGHPDLERIGSLNTPQLSNYIKDNPEIELHIARQLARHVNKQQHGDPLKSSYSWKFGHNLSPSSIGAPELNNKYVQDYQQLLHGNTVRGLRPASFTASHKIHKSEEDFTSRLKDWIKEREAQNQQNISNTMLQYTDIETISSPPDNGVKPPKDQNLDLTDPMDRMRLAIRKVVGEDDGDND